MTTAAHTPGPWMVPHFARDDVTCNCAFVLAEGYCGAIATIHVGNGLLIGEGGNDCPPMPEAQANARLIAAAPELLAMLSAVMRAPTGGVNDYCPIKARALIAKATGAAA